MTISIDTSVVQPPIALITACQQSDDGHNWIDITTLTDIDAKFICSCCDARGIERNN